LRKSLIINTPTRTRLKNTSNKEIFSGGFPDFKHRRRFPALFGGADTVSRVATAGRGCLYVQRRDEGRGKTNTENERITYGYENKENDRTAAR